MTHLGQRLSALIDGELELSERERVLVHMTRCGSCRDEVAALRMLKRRMSALGETAAAATGTAAANGLTGRLMSLSDLLGLDESGMSARMGSAESVWPTEPGFRSGGQAARPDQRAGRYFLAGSLAVFLAGLGTAAFIAGGEPQPSAPAAPLVPSVDVLVVPHPGGNEPAPAGTADPARLIRLRGNQSRVAHSPIIQSQVSQPRVTQPRVPAGWPEPPAVTMDLHRRT